MPNGNTYTTQEFATLIRDKYNAYSDISDEELVAKILEKYPIYRDQISDEKTSARKSKYLDFGEEEVIVEDEVVDGEVVEEDVEVIEEEKDMVYTMYDDAVKEEKRWIEYLFKDGSMVGLNDKLLSDYVEWIANKRMKAINLKPIYNISVRNDPLPWTQHWLNSRELQNAPQETEIESYVIGGIKQDITNDTFKGISL